MMPLIDEIMVYICDKINVAKYINDVDRLKNGTFEVDNIQKILSATYCDGQEIRDVTELLQMFNISGNFYDNNELYSEFTRGMLMRAKTKRKKDKKESKWETKKISSKSYSIKTADYKLTNNYN